MRCCPKRLVSSRSLYNLSVCIQALPRGLFHLRTKKFYLKLIQNKYKRDLPFCLPFPADHLPFPAFIVNAGPNRTLILPMLSP